MARTTRKEIDGIVGMFARMLGTRVARKYNDLGALTVEHSGYGYQLGEISSAGGGINTPIRSTSCSARELWDQVYAARSGVEMFERSYAAKCFALKTVLKPLVHHALDARPMVETLVNAICHHADTLPLLTCVHLYVLGGMGLEPYSDSLRTGSFVLETGAIMSWTPRLDVDRWVFDVEFAKTDCNTLHMVVPTMYYVHKR